MVTGLHQTTVDWAVPTHITDVGLLNTSSSKNGISCIHSGCRVETASLLEILLDILLVRKSIVVFDELPASGFGEERAETLLEMRGS